MGSKSARADVLKCLAVIGLSFLGAARADAGCTTMLHPNYANESDHAGVLDHTYGGTFTAVGNDFTNGAVTAMRCEDGMVTNGVLSSLSANAAADQLWTGGLLSGRVVARFAGSSQRFGYMDGAAGGSYHNLFDVNGNNFDVTGSFSHLNMNGTDFRWARAGEGHMFTSADLDNGGEDHLVTYRITGAGNGPATWLLCWEDVSGQGSDWDYNDLVVELKASGSIAVPLPPAVWSGLSMLVGGGILGSLRRIRRWLA